MSKKSERNTQIQKVRSAQSSQSQRRTEGLGPSAVKHQEEVRARRKPLPRWLFWTLVASLPLIGLSCLSGLVSVVLAPEVIPPAPVLANIAPSLDIINRSFLPLKSVEYSCALASVSDQSGFSVSDPSPDKAEKHIIGSLARGFKVPVTCDSHLNSQGLRIRLAESLVRVSYWHPGWPFRRHSEYRVRGEFDARGFPMRWAVE